MIRSATCFITAGVNGAKKKKTPGPAGIGNSVASPHMMSIGASPVISLTGCDSVRQRHTIQNLGQLDSDDAREGKTGRYQYDFALARAEINKRGSLTPCAPPVG